MPPQNKPTPAEIATCRRFLEARIAALPAPPRPSSASAASPTRRSCAPSAARLAAHPFGHGARHDLGGLAVFDSYHCSRYNTNTGRLTPEMFEAVFADLRAWLDRPDPVTS